MILSNFFVKIYNLYLVDVNRQVLEGLDQRSPGSLDVDGPGLDRGLHSLGDRDSYNVYQNAVDLADLDTCEPLPLSPLVLLKVSEMQKLCFMCVVVFLIRAWDITITASC